MSRPSSRASTPSTSVLPVTSPRPIACGRPAHRRRVQATTAGRAGNNPTGDGHAHVTHSGSPSSSRWRTWTPLLDTIGERPWQLTATYRSARKLAQANGSLRIYLLAPISNILVLHSGQVPSVAGRPFFTVIGFRSDIARLQLGARRTRRRRRRIERVLDADVVIGMNGDISAAHICIRGRRSRRRRP